MNYFSILKNKCKISNGIATLRDKIFIHSEKIYNEPCWKNITNGKNNKFSEKLFIFRNRISEIIDDNIQNQRISSIANEYVSTMLYNKFSDLS